MYDEWVNHNTAIKSNLPRINWALWAKHPTHQNDVYANKRHEFHLIPCQQDARRRVKKKCDANEKMKEGERKYVFSIACGNIEVMILKLKRWSTAKYRGKCEEKNAQQEQRKKNTAWSIVSQTSYYSTLDFTTGLSALACWNNSSSAV